MPRKLWQRLRPKSRDIERKSFWFRSRWHCQCFRCNLKWESEIKISKIPWWILEKFWKEKRRSQNWPEGHNYNDWNEWAWVIESYDKSTYFQRVIKNSFRGWRDSSPSHQTKYLRKNKLPLWLGLKWDKLHVGGRERNGKRGKAKTDFYRSIYGFRRHRLRLPYPICRRTWDSVFHFNEWW